MQRKLSVKHIIYVLTTVGYQNSLMLVDSDSGVGEQNVGIKGYFRAIFQQEIKTSLNCKVF
jgi:hypothetical protein